MKIKSWRELDAYKNAFVLQQALFEHSKNLPKREKYSLIDQIRRSSRSIESNIENAWANRRCPTYFVSNLTDSNGELQETLHWLSFTEACGYIDSAASTALQPKTQP